MPGSGTMTVKAAAAALGVHENTVRNWINAGLLPAAELPSGNRRPLAAAVAERAQALADIELDATATAKRLEGLAGRLDAQAERLRRAAVLIREDARLAQQRAGIEG